MSGVDGMSERDLTRVTTRAAHSTKNNRLLYSSPIYIRHTDRNSNIRCRKITHSALCSTVQLIYTYVRLVYRYTVSGVFRRLDHYKLIQLSASALNTQKCSLHSVHSFLPKTGAVCEDTGEGGPIGAHQSHEQDPV